MLDTNEIARATVVHHRGIPVVVVTGEVDSSTVAPVRTRLVDELAHRPRGLVLDLSRVGFIGSTGLQLLAEAVVQARGQGTALAVVAGHRAVLLPMRVTELDRAVVVRDTLDHAVTAVLSH
ncbi:STAS domain-containing protein [Saccharothrix syringae]|uniref:STAS domain-containing protein n=1 Tax=Saccharothrix syringae TaxID=103733 RepID=UPI00068DD577|nr:STAS domain-containing protein [Saccharothrix syringae]